MTNRPLTRAEWVDGQLRAAILNGDLEPGEKLRTEELAERWSVSPTPLRETYQRLAAEGLVELVPQRGARVADVSMDDALEIYDLRQLLEPYALRLSLEEIDDGLRERIRETFGPLRARLENHDGDLAALEAVHREFHMTLLSRCGSAWLLRIIRILQDHSVRYRLLSIEPRGGLDEVLVEHEELLAACLAGELDVAAQRLHDHLQLTIDSLAGEITDLDPSPDAGRTEEVPT